MNRAKIAIVYHEADFDGKLSNLVCRYHLEKQLECEVDSFGWDYGKPLPEADWSEFQTIFIVDLSVPELMDNPGLRSRIIWIDHHRTAIDRWGGAMDGFFLDGVAACRLCWQWFTAPAAECGLPCKADFVERKVKEPELIRLAGEYDVWDKRDPDAERLQFGLRLLIGEELDVFCDREFSRDDAGLSNFAADLVRTGAHIKYYCDKQNAEYARDCAQTVYWEGLVWCALNIGQRGNSDLLKGGIKPEHRAGMAWRYTGKEVYVSLYHLPNQTDIDLSVIAKKYGGGGHKGACGFRMSLRQFAAEVIEWAPGTAEEGSNHRGTEAQSKA